LSASAPSSHDLSLAAFTINIAESNFRHTQPARIYPWRKMHRSRAPSIAPGTFFVAQPWADCITNMPGFNLRQAQGSVPNVRMIITLNRDGMLWRMPTAQTKMT
jgi:hypothetical protein